MLRNVRLAHCRNPRLSVFSSALHTERAFDRSNGAANILASLQGIGRETSRHSSVWSNSENEVNPTKKTSKRKSQKPYLAPRRQPGAKLRITKVATTTGPIIHRSSTLPIRLSRPEDHVDPEPVLTKSPIEQRSEPITIKPRRNLDKLVSSRQKLFGQASRALALGDLPRGSSQAELPEFDQSKENVKAEDLFNNVFERWEPDVSTSATKSNRAGGNFTSLPQRPQVPGSGQKTLISTYSKQQRSYSSAAGLEFETPSDSSKGSNPSKSSKSKAKGPPIRETLAMWEMENVDRDLPVPEPPDLGAIGKTNNEITRPSSLADQMVDDRAEGDSLDMLSDHGEFFTSSDRRTFLRRGDLVELGMSGGGQGELAIFVQSIGTQSQFFTMSGKYTHLASQNIQFYVKNFVRPHELDPILPYLPKEILPKDQESRLHSLLSAPPRTVSSPLLEKLFAFSEESLATYRATASKLDSAHQLLADETQYRYATLEEIADVLVPKNLLKQMKGRDSRYLPPVLHAVYRSILSDPIGFRAQRHLRHAGLFEISPLVEVRTARSVVTHVREYQSSLLSDKTQPRSSRAKRVAGFIAKCQQLIDESRRNRPITAYDTVGPAVATPSSKPSVTFDDWELNFVRFIESWAALSTFSLHSEINSIPSMLLRATRRYNDRDYTKGTGWLFLQEIGIIPPWQTKIGFDLRLPQTGLRLQDKELSAPMSTESIDTAEPFRKDWGDLDVYCIDNVDAHEIDDGISIEPAEAGTHWIHVHVADPCSQISPDSDMAKRAQEMGETVYTPDRVVFMLPSQFSEQFGLASNRRVLTFSIQVDMNGNILDQNVTAGIVRNVKYITYDTLQEVVEGKSLTTSTEIAVGENPPPSEHRPMTGIEGLSSEQKNDLNTLHNIAKNRDIAKRDAGALNAFSNKPEVQVRFRNSVVREGNNIQPMNFGEDPYIKMRFSPFSPFLSLDRHNAVAGAMQLACEAAARWCDERGIPVPFRVTEPNPDRPDATNFFRENILPQIRQDGTISRDVAMAYGMMLGAAMPSATAAPHLSMAVEKYARCTSPLRRYIDMVVHWQVHAALREEAKTGTSLIGSTRTDYLPFTREDLDKLLPVLHTKEASIKRTRTVGVKPWIVQLLLRSKGLPETFDFVALDVFGTTVRGVLTDYSIEATFELPSWLKAADLRPGDRFESKIAKMSAYTGTIEMEALKRAGRIDL